MKTPHRCTISGGLALIAAFSLLATPFAEAQINYQGILTDASGTPLPDGQTNITFSLWDEATVGNKIWGDYVLDGTAAPGHGPQADVVNGRFNVIIGNLDVNNASLTSSMDAAATLYLQIQVAANPAIMPRQAILATPRALMADKVRDNAVTRASLIQEVADALCPPGSIMPFAGTSVPDGWLACDGSPASSTQYARLNAAIGVSWGDGSNDGDSLTDFNIPDLRGVFLRGVNGARNDDYKAPDEVTYTITAAIVSSDSEADLTISALEPFPETLNLTVADLSLSDATIPDGVYSATRITATNWRISGGTGFTIGNHTALSGSATGSGRRVGSFQADRMPIHNHKWGQTTGSRTLQSYRGPDSTTLENVIRETQDGGAGGTQLDDVHYCENPFELYTDPTSTLPKNGETRPNNAAVNYIIKY